MLLSFADAHYSQYQKTCYFTLPTKRAFFGPGWIASEWVYKMVGLAKSRVLLKAGKIFLFSLPFKLQLWNKTPVLSFVWQNRRLSMKINLKHQLRLQMQYTHFVLPCHLRIWFYFLFVFFLELIKFSFRLMHKCPNLLHWGLSSYITRR